jgi:hypothetical protein
MGDMSGVCFCEYQPHLRIDVDIDLPVAQ